MDLNIIAHEAESDRACERCLIIENVCLGAECARADAADRNGGGTVGNIEKEALRAAPRARSDQADVAGRGDRESDSGKGRTARCAASRSGEDVGADRAG